MLKDGNPVARTAVAVGERRSRKDQAMNEKNLGSVPEDAAENLKAAEGKNVPHPAPDVVGADELPGKTTARGRYGEPNETETLPEPVLLDAEGFYPASNKLQDEPELGSLK
jgi:hypothetical protein